MSFSSFVDHRQAERDATRFMPSTLPRRMMLRQPELCHEPAYGVNETVYTSLRPVR